MFYLFYLPRLELCGAVVLSRLISHVAKIFDIPTRQIYCRTDSLVVLGWLRRNPRTFKTFVGNHASEVIDAVPPSCWRYMYVNTETNPADCASRGLFPAELDTIFGGTAWIGFMARILSGHLILKYPTNQYWTDEEKDARIEECFAIMQNESSLPLLEKISSYMRPRRVMAWIFRFIKNCRQTGREKC